ncbi:hypothetical protein GCM10027073_06690 [Streptomyces chlorus]
MYDEYATRYGEEAHAALARYPDEEFTAPLGGVLLLLLEHGEPVAGGAFRRYDVTTAELKRIWTHSAHRRRGLAWPGASSRNWNVRRRPAATGASTSPPVHASPRRAACTWPPATRRCSTRRPTRKPSACCPSRSNCRPQHAWHVREGTGSRCGRDRAPSHPSDGFRELGRQECMRLMGTVPVGRIVHTRRALPAVLPVDFDLVRPLPGSTNWPRTEGRSTRRPGRAAFP